MISFRKNGGMWFWRIGRLGGSFYVSKPGAAERSRYRRMKHQANVAHVRFQALCWRQITREPASGVEFLENN